MPEISRRGFIGLTGAALLASTVETARAAPARRFVLTAGRAKAQLVGPGFPETDVWAYNGSVPGPVLRARQGETVEILLRNQLPEPTTVHWHGVRVPNSQDGVPGVTQKPVPPGGMHTYRFAVPDAGTFWYHPHANSAEQIGRGLYGALIVDEAQPPSVDQDIVLVLDDWRLDRSAQLDPSWGHMHDLTHGGRLGNVGTVNGTVDFSAAVKAGARVRLRLINTANARVFYPNLSGLDAWIVAWDGQPIVPEKVTAAPLPLGPGMRVDLIADMPGTPGAAVAVRDTPPGQDGPSLVRLKVAKSEPQRTKKLPAPARLPDNPLAKPDLANAVRLPMVLGGGAMGAMMRGGMPGGPMMGMREMMRRRMFWSLNGRFGFMDRAGDPAPIATLRHGKTYILRIENQTAFPHPMHLHGMTFFEIERNGKRLAQPVARDTVLLDRNETVDVAFVADNRGDWLFHCHILEHQKAGMSALYRVA